MSARAKEDTRRARARETSSSASRRGSAGAAGSYGCESLLPLVLDDVVVRGGRGALAALEETIRAARRRRGLELWAVRIVVGSGLLLALRAVALAHRERLVRHRDGEQVVLGARRERDHRRRVLDAVRRREGRDKEYILTLQCVSARAASVSRFRERALPAFLLSARARARAQRTWQQKPARDEARARALEGERRDGARVVREPAASRPPASTSQT